MKKPKPPKKRLTKTLEHLFDCKWNSYILAMEDLIVPGENDRELSLIKRMAKLWFFIGANHAPPDAN